MIPRDKNPEYLNSFLDYSITILNKSPNSVKEYNYDLAIFLKFIKIRFRSSVGLKRWTVNPKWFSTSTVRICSKSR